MKKYMKPEFSIVELRPEETLSTMCYSGTAMAYTHCKIKINLRALSAS